MKTFAPNPIRLAAVGLVVCGAGTAWSQTSQVVPAPADARDFGACTAIGGGILFVAAAHTAENQGAVFAYDLAGDLASPMMIFQEKLGPDADFGRSIATDGEWLAVCAGFASTASNERGRLFLYRKTGDTWLFSDSVDVPTDSCGGCWSEGPNTITFAGDQLIWGHGAFDSPSSDQGAVHVYDIADGALDHRQSLQHSTGSAWDYFGNSGIACDGDRMMACAVLEDLSGPQYGAVVAYQRGSDGLWSETQMIAINPSLGSFPNFGASIAISGSRAVISAGNANGEHVYVMELNGKTNTWELQTELDLAGSGPSHSPRVVMPSSDRIVVSSRGRILTFDFVDPAWVRTSTLEWGNGLADGAVERRQLSTDGRFVAAGAEYESQEDQPNYAEFTLVIDLETPPSLPCPADLSENGVVDGGDLGIWLALAGNDCQSDPGCPADLNGDGIIDGADIGVILGAWGPCPD